MTDINTQAIGGSLIPIILKAVAVLLDEERNPGNCTYIFDSMKKELRVLGTDWGKDHANQVLHTIPY